MEEEEEPVQIEPQTQPDVGDSTIAVDHSDFPAPIIDDDDEPQYPVTDAGVDIEEDIVAAFSKEECPNWSLKINNDQPMLAYVDDLIKKGLIDNTHRRHDGTQWCFRMTQKLKKVNSNIVVRPIDAKTIGDFPDGLSVDPFQDILFFFSLVRLDKSNRRKAEEIEITRATFKRLANPINFY